MLGSDEGGEEEEAAAAGGGAPSPVPAASPSAAAGEEGAAAAAAGQGDADDEGKKRDEEEEEDDEAAAAAEAERDTRQRYEELCGSLNMDERARAEAWLSYQSMRRNYTLEVGAWLGWGRGSSRAPPVLRRSWPRPLVQAPSRGEGLAEGQAGQGGPGTGWHRAVRRAQWQDPRPPFFLVK